MRVLVTGAAGFVGSNLARALLAQGHEVVGIDCLTDYYEVALKERNLSAIPADRFTLVRGDLNEVDLDRLLDGVDWVFHEAGQPGVRMSWGRDFEIYVRHNISATQRLLEAAQRSPSLRRLVYASSSSVYGNAETYPTRETDRPQPVSPYGVTKLAAEHLCSLYASNFGVPTVSLRYFTVYGPGQRTDMAFTRFVRAAVLDELITIFGDGEQIRDFTFIDDIVAANLLAAGSDVPAGSVFNVAGGSNVSVNETLATLADLAGHPLRIDYVDRVAGDVLRTGGSTEKIQEALGWQPQVTIEQGLARHLAWGREAFAPSR
jgi:UDP-glucuronate 4-epimerase